MKKLVLFAICVLTGGVIYANSVRVMSLNFVAPQVDGKENVYLPTVGEIIYDGSDHNFYGRTATNQWTQFGSGSGDGAPAGTISMFAGAADPDGYFVADGRAVSRATYAALFSVIGTTYGTGDGSTTFNIPDMRGLFVRGAGSQTVSGVSYSGTLAAKQGDQFQGHRHNLNSNLTGSTAATVSVLGLGTAGTGVTLGPSTGDWYHSGIGVRESITDGTNGTPRVGSETRPANISLNYIIKY